MGFFFKLETGLPGVKQEIAWDLVAPEIKPGPYIAQIHLLALAEKAVSIMFHLLSPMSMVVKQKQS